jgi:hypothetical protein
MCRAVIGQRVRVVDPLDAALEVEGWFEQQGFVMTTRGTPDGVAVDLVGDINPAVELRGYGLGPDPVLAVLAAEQRWLAEEEGRGSEAGETYVEKAQGAAASSTRRPMTAGRTRSPAGW